MSRISSAAASLIFLAVAPGTLAGWLPWSLSRGWRMQPPFLGLEWMRWLGALLIAGGAVLLLECFARFAFLGRGTPAPILPTERLVVTGMYRHVRNPMYVAVTSLILGQALLLGSQSLLYYAGVVWCGFHLFVLAYEEPTLRDSYPAEYERFCANVPRWIPRWHPWNPRSS